MRFPPSSGLAPLTRRPPSRSTACRAAAWGSKGRLRVPLSRSYSATLLRCSILSSAKPGGPGQRRSAGEPSCCADRPGTADTTSAGSKDSRRDAHLPTHVRYRSNRDSAAGPTTASDLHTSTHPRTCRERRGPQSRGMQRSRWSTRCRPSWSRSHVMPCLRRAVDSTQHRRNEFTGGAGGLDQAEEPARALPWNLGGDGSIGYPCRNTRMESALSLA